MQPSANSAFLKVSPRQIQESAQEHKLSESYEKFVSSNEANINEYFFTYDLFIRSSFQRFKEDLETKDQVIIDNFCLSTKKLQSALKNLRKTPDSEAIKNEIAKLLGDCEADFSRIKQLKNDYYAVMFSSPNLVNNSNSNQDQKQHAVPYTPVRTATFVPGPLNTRKRRVEATNLTATSSQSAQHAAKKPKTSGSYGADTTPKLKM